MEKHIYLDPKKIPGDTVTDLTSATLRAIKFELSNNQFAHFSFTAISSKVVSGIYESFKTFLSGTNSQKGFYVDYNFENRDDKEYCEVTQVKVSLSL